MKEYRCVLITAVVYSMIIGSIYVTLSVLGILARNCVIDMNGSPLVYMIFLLYFRTDSCTGLIIWENLDITSGVTASLPDYDTAAVHRTFIFSIIYLSLYGALIFAALFSLCGISNSCLGRKSFPIFFAPWILVCCLVVVMDIVATTYYIRDSVSTASVGGLMELLEIGNPDAVGAVFESLAPQWRFLPPIIMFLATSKCFIFLIIDIVVITMIIRAGWAASTYHKYVDDTIRQYSSNMNRTNPAFEDTQNDIVAQKQHNKQLEYIADQTQIQEMPIRTAAAANAPPETPDRYNDTSVQAFVYPDRNAYNRNEQRQQEENQNTNPRPNSLALNSKLNERPQQNNNQQPIGYGRQNGNAPQNVDKDIESRLSHFASSNGNVVRSVEPLKDENLSDRQQQQMRVRVMPMVAEINRHSSEVKQRPAVPPKPYNPNRVSKQPSMADDRRHERPESRNSGAKVDRNSSMNGPEELRNQMPWSYFKARDDIPKKAFTELKEDEELPPVPIPDYTLHFPKNKRPNLGSDSDGDGSWSRHDQNQRY